MALRGNEDLLLPVAARNAVVKQLMSTDGWTGRTSGAPSMQRYIKSRLITRIHCHGYDPCTVWVRSTN